MLSMTSRPGASKFFTDLAREVAPVDPDLARSPRSVPATA
jgi:hypothetical protein